MTSPSTGAVGAGAYAGPAPSPGASGAHLGPASGSDDLSVGELIGEVTRDFSTLMRQEIELAKAEITQEAVKTGRAAGMLSAAGFAGYMVLLFLSVALGIALAHVMDLARAMLIVAAVWAVPALLLYSAGRRQLQRVHPKPQRTVETLKEVPDAMRGR
jgi:hypothetical protein